MVQPLRRRETLIQVIERVHGKPTRDVLQALYRDAGMNQTSIAALFNSYRDPDQPEVHPSSVSRLMKQFGIPTREADAELHFNGHQS